MARGLPAPILVFLGLSVLDLGPMYATDRRQTDRQTSDRRQIKASLNGSAVWGWRHNKATSSVAHHPFRCRGKQPDLSHCDYFLSSAWNGHQPVEYRFGPTGLNMYALHGIATCPATETVASVRWLALF